MSCVALVYRQVGCPRNYFFVRVGCALAGDPPRSPQNECLIKICVHIYPSVLPFYKENRNCLYSQYSGMITTNILVYILLILFSMVCTYVAVFQFPITVDTEHCICLRCTAELLDMYVTDEGIPNIPSTTGHRP